MEMAPQMASHTPWFPAASSRLVAYTVRHTPRSVALAPQAFLTPQYLAIAMEYASGGDMFEHVVRKGGLKENEARWFFQQLTVGVDYVHKMVRRLCPPCSTSYLIPPFAMKRSCQTRRGMVVICYAGRRKQGHQTGEHPFGRQPPTAGEDL